MTQPAQSVSNLPAITPQMVFAAVSDAQQASCYWCRKLMKVYNGERTLLQVAELLHLPVSTCMRLTRRAYQEGWIAPTARESQKALWNVLLDTLGEGSEDVLKQAAYMSRCEPGAISCAEAGSFLIAVELLLPESQRPTFTPLLDVLRLEYTC